MAVRPISARFLSEEERIRIADLASRVCLAPEAGAEIHRAARSQIGFRQVAA
jgi:hypothetical protein